MMAYATPQLLDYYHSVCTHYRLLFYCPAASSAVVLCRSGTISQSCWPIATYYHLVWNRVARASTVSFAVLNAIRIHTRTCTSPSLITTFWYMPLSIIPFFYNTTFLIIFYCICTHVHICICACEILSILIELYEPQLTSYVIIYNS